MEFRFGSGFLARCFFGWCVCGGVGQRTGDRSLTYYFECFEMGRRILLLLPVRP